MILDRLEQSVHYAPLGDVSPRVSRICARRSGATSRTGDYEIEGKNVARDRADVSPEAHAEGRWEAHRDHADIQFVVIGAERWGVRRSNGSDVESAYDPAEGRGVLPRRRPGNSFEGEGGGVRAASIRYDVPTCPTWCWRAAAPESVA
jgi:beta-galactosidase beta subunit